MGACLLFCRAKKKIKILKILKACKGLVYFPDRQDVNLQCAFDAAVTTNRRVTLPAFSSLKEGMAREKNKKKTADGGAFLYIPDPSLSC